MKLSEFLANYRPVYSMSGSCRELDILMSLQFPNKIFLTSSLLSQIHISSTDHVAEVAASKVCCHDTNHESQPVKILDAVV